MFSVSSLFKTVKKNQAGFGLIELLVSVSIMMLVSAVLLVRQEAFNNTILLRNQAYEVALAIREVQLNTVSAVGVTDGTTSSFRTSLGVYFDTSTDSVYQIFKDSGSNPDHRYSGTGEQYGKQGSIDGRFEIRAIKAIGAGGSVTDLNNVSVLFQRPNFDAYFYNSSGYINAAKIQIEISKRDETGTGIDSVRLVEITSTGQIAVQ